MESTLQNATNVLIADLLNLDTTLNTNIHNVEVIDNNTAMIESDIMSLNTTLQTFQANTTSNQDLCINTIAPTLMGATKTMFLIICNEYPVSTALTFNVNYNSFPNLSSIEQALQSVNSGNLTAQAQHTRDMLSNISTTLRNDVISAHAQISRDLSDFHTTLANKFNNFTDKINTQFDSKFNFHTLHRDVNVCLIIFNGLIFEETKTS